MPTFSIRNPWASEPVARHGGCSATFLPGLLLYVNFIPAEKESAMRQNPRPSIRARAGAAGKALIVYLASGSIGVALVAFLLFKVMGC